MPNEAVEQQEFGQFNWLIKQKQFNKNIKTRVNIDKNENKTKINMEYVDILDPHEDEMLNDKEFLQQFNLEQLSQNNKGSIISNVLVAPDISKT